MTRLLSILLLALLLSGFGAPGVPDADAAAPQNVVLGQGGGDPGGRMAMGCPACPMMGACAAAESTQWTPPGPSSLKLSLTPSQTSDQIRAPDTAPPKPFSV